MNNFFYFFKIKMHNGLKNKYLQRIRGVLGILVCYKLFSLATRIKF